jgi:RimJ/RimL family protein N-acetyltransferase
MPDNLFTGQWVHLGVNNPDELAKADVRWRQDSEFFRLLDSEAPVLWSEKKIKDWIEKDLDKQVPGNIFFNIHRNEDDALIGFIGFFNLQWNHGDTLVAIALGEREYWGKGYGTDAMRVILRYGFEELNLHRVGLIVFEYNPRARRSYEKAGFEYEGRIRGAMLREGRRWDWHMMGLLKEKWLRMQQEAVNGENPAR